MIIKSNLINLETLILFPSSWSLEIYGIISFKTIKIEILTPQKYPRLTYKLENGVSFQSFAFLNLDALDFT